MHRPEYDVIVVGSGNAGFSAALSAREHGAKKVLLVDKCPPEWAGGNTYFTAGAYRTAFDGLEDVLSFVTKVKKERAERIDMAAYTKQDFWNDLMRVTNGRADPELGKVLVEESREAVGWLVKQGIKFQLSFNRCCFPLSALIVDKHTRWTAGSSSGEGWSCPL
jgi:succinate dehydrogenase/fumarate reductase flavoprotein subunit